MPTPAWLGLDLGTSSVKALLLAPDGRLLGEGTAAYGFAPAAAPGHAEQDPEAWWRAAAAATRAACAAAGSAVVGLTTTSLPPEQVALACSRAQSCASSKTTLTPPAST